MFRDTSAGTDSAAGVVGGMLDELTPREREVVRLMAKGLTNPAIGQELGIGLETAKTHVQRVIAKTGARSREEAVAVWRRHNRPTARLRRRMGAMVGGPVMWKGLAVSAAALAVGLLAIALVALSFGWSGGPSRSTTRLLIAQSMRPEPGLRVIDMSEGSEDVFLEEYGEIDDWVVWSPTGGHLVAETAGDPRRLLILDYPSGLAAVLEDDRAECELTNHQLPPSHISAACQPEVEWSPDGTRLVTLGERVRLHAADGTTLATIELEQLLPGQTFLLGLEQMPGWSPDSSYFGIRFIRYIRDVRTTLIGRDGGVLIPVEAPEDYRQDEFLRQLPVWDPDAGAVLWTGVGEPAFRGTIDGPRVAWTRQQAAPAYLRPLQQRNPLYALAAIEERAPAGFRAVWEGPVLDGWGASFVSDLPDADSAARPLTLFRLGDEFFEFRGTIRADLPTWSVTLGIDRPALPVPDIDVSGCPIAHHADSLFLCQVSIYNARLIIDGDLDSLMERAAPEYMSCHEPPSHGRAACASSSTGMSRAVFGLGLRSRSVALITAPEYRRFLSELHARMENAVHTASDETGSGEPKIIGITCGPTTTPVEERGAGGTTAELEGPCGPVSINVSWLEGEGGDLQRIVVGLDMGGASGVTVRGPDTGYAIALTGGSEPGRAVGTEYRAYRWTPPEE